MKFSNAFLEAADSIFMPGDCPGSGEPVEDGPYRRLCEWCVRCIEWFRRPFCERCGSPLLGTAIAVGDCPHCGDLQPSFSAGRALFLLTGVARSFVHGVKYHGDRCLLYDLPRLMNQSPDFIQHLKDAVYASVASTKALGLPKLWRVVLDLVRIRKRFSRESAIPATKPS